MCTIEPIPSREFRGAPHVVFKVNQRHLVEGSHRGSASAPSAPIEWDRALPSESFESALMDVSRDHEPTLIERGMNVHLNHPIIAHRGIRDSRPIRGKHGLLHPSSPRKGVEGLTTKLGTPP
jgi:hypothetical protein